MTITTTPAPLAAKAAAAGTPARKNRFWSWLIYVAGAVYFLTPLAATFYWSLRAEKGKLGFEAYRRLFAETDFLPAFSESLVNAVAAILLSLLLIVPTAYWVTLRLPKLRPVVEFITLLPFVIPAVVLVFGLLRLYSRPPLLLTATYDSSRVLLVCVYAALSFPYMFRAVDNGLRRANSVQAQPDVGHRLENAVALHLRQQTPALSYAGERGLWECDFVTPDAAIQVCMELTPANRNRELRGAVEGARLRGRRRGLIVTLDQADRLVEDGVAIDVVPAWRWMT